MSRSVQDQSRDTSGSSRWFIHISSLVASLMNVTRLFKWLMRFTEHFYKRKHFHWILLGVIGIYDIGAKNYGNTGYLENNRDMGYWEEKIRDIEQQIWDTRICPGSFRHSRPFVKKKTPLKSYIACASKEKAHETLSHTREV